MAKILLVEDSPNTVELLAEYLQDSNLEVVVATYAPQGVSMAKSERPDLILMDWSLPDQPGGVEHPRHGQAATRAIRAIDELKDVPIIAVSASRFPHEEQEMRQAGCTAIVSKPFDLDKLLETITSLLAAGTKR